MTHCLKYQDDLKAYADGELPLLRRAAVRRHLTHCASCREEITFMTQISDDLRTMEPGDGLPSSLREKMLGVPLVPNNGGTEKETEPLSSGFPIIGGGGASLRKHRVPAWTFAALAVVAWFALYPLYQKTREQATMTRNTAMMQSPTSSVAVPPPVQVALSQSAAGAQATPPPPPKHRPAPPEMNSMPSAVTAAAAPSLPDRAVAQTHEMHTTRLVPPAFSSSGSAATNTINGEPDSLRQVHKEASIGLQVPNPEATGDKLNQMVQETGGYVAANNLTTGDNGLRSGELIVKVPEPQFETFLASVAKLGVVMSKNVTGQDITEKTSDAHEAQSVQESDLAKAEARLKALGSHAKWEDQENTRDLRVQLAQTRARLKLLKRMAALGTLTIDLSQTPKDAAVPPVTGGFVGTLKTTTHDALQSLVGSAGALLALVIWLLAYAPLWVPLLLLGRYALKEYRKQEAI